MEDSDMEVDPNSTEAEDSGLDYKEYIRTFVRGVLSNDYHWRSQGFSQDNRSLSEFIEAIQVFVEKFVRLSQRRSPESSDDSNGSPMIIDDSGEDLTPLFLASLEVILRVQLSLSSRLGLKSSRTGETSPFKIIKDSILFVVKSFSGMISSSSNESALSVILGEICSILVELMDFRQHGPDLTTKLITFQGRVSNIEPFNRFDLGKMSVGNRTDAIDKMALVCIDILKEFPNIHVFNSVKPKDKLMNLSLSTEIQELRKEAIRLFFTSSKCSVWTESQIEFFITTELTPMILKTNKRSQQEVKPTVEVIFGFLHFSRSNKWRKRLLLLLIQIFWDASLEVYQFVYNQTHQSKLLTRLLGGISTEMLLKDNVDFIVENMMKILVDQEAKTAGQSSSLSSGGMFIRAIDFFDAKILNQPSNPVMAIVMAFLALTPSDMNAVAVFKSIIEEKHLNLTKQMKENLSLVIPLLIQKTSPQDPVFENSCAHLVSLTDGKSQASKQTSKFIAFVRESSHLVRNCLPLYHSHKKSVTRAINIYNRSQIEPYPTGQIDNEEALKNYLILNPRKHLRVFVSDLRILTKDIEKEVGQEENDCKGNRLFPYKEAIESLMDLLDVVGPEGCDPLYPDIAAILLEAVCQLDLLTDSECLLLLRLYESFIKNLSLDTIKCKLEIICKDLRTLLLRDKIREEVAKVLKNLLLPNQKKLKDKFFNLHFLQDFAIPSMKEVNECISREIRGKKEDKSREEEVLEMSQEILRQNDMGVKYLFIKNLRKFIEKHYFELMPGKGEVRSWMSQVVSNLMKDVKTPDENVRLAVAECLGEIGAVDPAIFETIPLFESVGNTFPWNVTSDEFLTAILNKLGSKIKEIGQANNLYTVQFAIQELMKKLRDNSNRIDSFLSSQTSMDSETLNVCKEFAGTDLRIDEHLIWDEVRRQTSPVIFSKEISNTDWMRIWSKKMISLMNPQSKTTEILKCVVPVFAIDSLICESLLPCIVYNFLVDKKVDKDTKKRVVYDELMVIVQASVPEPIEGGFSYNNSVSSNMEGKLNVTAIVTSSVQHLCAQQIFIIYDALRKWTAFDQNTDVQFFLESISKSHLSSLAFGFESYARALLYLEKYLLEQRFLSRSNGSDFNLVLDYWLEHLQKIYVALDEPDGVDGAAAIRKRDASLVDQLLSHEAENRLQDAFTCCEKGIRREPANLEFHRKTLRSLLGLDQTATAMEFSKGLLIGKPSDWRKKVTPFMVETAWKLSKWDELKDCLEACKSDLTVESTNMGMNIGQLLSCVSDSDADKLQETLERVRIKTVTHLSAVVSESDAYLRCYKDLGKLHMITDIEKTAMVFKNLPAKEATSFKRLASMKFTGGLEADVSQNELAQRYIDELLSARNSRVVPSPRSLEPILCLQRVLYSFAPTCDETSALPVFNSWLKSAKIARKSGNLQRAYSCLLEIQDLVEKHCVTDNYPLISVILVEQAKYLWSKGDLDSRDSAIRQLSKGITRYFKYDVKPLNGFSPMKATRSKSEKERSDEMAERSSDVQVLFADEEMRKMCAKVKLVQTRFMQEMQTVTSEDLAEEYKVTIAMDKKWEKSIICLAKHYDAVHQAAKDSQKDKISNQTRACQQYFNALIVGCRFSHESLPRLLHIWAELATQSFCLEAVIPLTQHKKDTRNKSPDRKKPRNGVSPARAVSQEQKELKEKAKTCFEEIRDQCIARLKDKLPSYILYNCFSQLMSRLNHMEPQVGQQFKEIVSKIVADHPDQSLWLLLSTYMTQTSRNESKMNVEDIITQANLRNRDIYKSFHNLYSVAEAFVQLANFRAKYSSFNLNEQKNLGIQKRVEGNRGLFLIPHRNFFRVSMPPEGVYDVNDKRHSFQSGVYITRVRNNVKVFASLAKPKQVTLVGSDGKTYGVIAKPSDNLKIDARAQEFLEVVNRLLKKDPESRKRQLSIRVFQVIPMGNTSGLIEMLEGLTDLRGIVKEAYGNPVVIQNMAQVYPKDDSLTVSQKTKKWKSQIMPHFKPPVLNAWFMKHFQDASEWHVARNNFIRSNAVMSMVGYIIGLGDRHLENILLDCKTGQVVHVDFDALFNKGERMAVPEVVPFRLTHNIIDAMGVTGYEGHFRKSCEVTLRVMRSHRNALMSVLYPFVLDPVVGATAPVKNRDNLVREMKSNAISAKGEEIDNWLNPEATYSLHRIQNRLKGLMKDGKVIVKEGKTEYIEPKSLLPVSVSGQVNMLIEQATDEGRLASMFYGWASYL